METENLTALSRTRRTFSCEKYFLIRKFRLASDSAFGSHLAAFVWLRCSFFYEQVTSTSLLYYILRIYRTFILMENNKKNGRVDTSLYEIQKRLPPRFHTDSSRDIYITRLVWHAKNDSYIVECRKTKIAAQFSRCKKLLDRKSDDIVIHALGNAINRAIALALRLENAMKNSVRLSILTSSVKVLRAKCLYPMIRRHIEFNCFF